MKKITKLLTHIPFFTIINLCLDILLIPIIFIIAYSIKFKIGWFFQNIFNLHIGKIYEFAQIEPYLSILWLIVMLWVSSFWYTKMYRLPIGVMPEADIIIKVIKGVTIATLELMALSFIYKSFPGSRFVLFYAWILSIPILSLSRLAILHLSILKNRSSAKKVVVIGADEFGQDVVERILLNPALQLNYIGTIAENEPEKLHFHLRNKFKLLGNSSQIQEILTKNHINAIYITDKELITTALNSLAIFCETHNIEIKILSDLVKNISMNCFIEDFDGLPFEVHQPLSVNIYYKTIKLAFDFCFALTLLIFLSPLFLIIALLIKIASPNGPIFYVQERVGLNGKPFGMIKFRTMIPNAESKTGPVMVSTQTETRYIPCGNLLRKTSIDELPQLINILKGEMSLVGPRPERAFFVEKFKQNIPYFDLRHKVKGGITGWAQINGRSVLTNRPEHKIKYDLYYIKNWSFILDIKIIIKTIFIVLKREEAY